jgi:acyl-coenzyme A synthetase/AMP-(fatty) acid ligase
MYLNIDKKEKDSIAIICDTCEKLSYGQLCEIVNDFGKNCPQRTLVFILAENTLGTLLSYIVSLSNRLVPLLVSANMDSLLLQDLIRNYQPEYLWLPEDLVSTFGYPVQYRLANYCLVETDLSPFPLNEELSMLLPTSGSTGSSKLVRHSYRNLEANAQNVAELFNISSQDRAITSLPIYYTMGLSVINSHLYAGATLLLTNRGLLETEFWTFLKEQKATIFTGVPYSYELLSKLRFFKMNLPDLKTITQGGGRMDDELFRQCAEYAKKNDKKFIATYGQTEGTARMAYLPTDLAMEKTGSIGIAVPHGELYMVDEHRETITRAEVCGQMVFKGENVTLGYACCGNDLQKGDENNGVLYTGDLARCDIDGCYYIVGRMGRFLKLFGLREGLDECEHIIRSTLSIDCACVGNDACMSVYITDAQQLETVKMLLEERTKIIGSAFKVEVIKKIPKNEFGKIVYSQLNNTI